jgi:DNA helicase-2/ATP-dependent DNA helicase PcrA
VIAVRFSHYQEAIFAEVTDGHGDLVVNAVAGSGKTSTIVECANRVQGASVLFLAFNNAIVKELKSRLPKNKNVEVRTIHGLGQIALIAYIGRDKIQGGPSEHKYAELAHENIRGYVPHCTREQEADVRRIVIELVVKAQANLVDPTDEALANLADHYGIDTVVSGSGVDESQIYGFVREVLADGIKLTRQGLIAFADMVWLPAHWKLRPREADFIFVDEAQDLSKANLATILACRAAGGRMVFVGDPRQSIYGFTGADVDSFDNIKKATNATELPLSVSYRCPRSVVARAQRIVPEIERPRMHRKGSWLPSRPHSWWRWCGQGDLILCRTTAPLVAWCIRLIGKRIGAKVKGRDIATGLIKVATDALGSRPYGQLEGALDEHLAKRLRELSSRQHSEALQLSLRDKVDGVRACLEAFPRVQTLDAFTAEVNIMFTDETAVVELSTVHKAKGLGNRRVFIVEPQKLPLVWKNQRAWEAVQEKNLEYVAYTRSQGELYFVH